MTRQHYQMIAEELNAALEVSRGQGREALNTTMRAIEGLAVVFQRDNARFDRQRFFKACGVKAGDGLK